MYILYLTGVCNYIQFNKIVTTSTIRPYPFFQNCMTSKLKVRANCIRTLRHAQWKRKGAKKQPCLSFKLVVPKIDLPLESPTPSGGQSSTDSLKTNKLNNPNNTKTPQHNIKIGQKHNAKHTPISATAYFSVLKPWRKEVSVPYIFNTVAL